MSRAERRRRRRRYIVRRSVTAVGQRREVRAAAGRRDPRAHVVVVRQHRLDRLMVMRMRVMMTVVFRQPALPRHGRVIRRRRRGRRRDRVQLTAGGRTAGAHADALHLPAVLHVQQVRVPALRGGRVRRRLLAHRHRDEYVPVAADRRQHAGGELGRRRVHRHARIARVVALDRYVHRLLVTAAAHGGQRDVLKRLFHQLEVLARGSAAATATGAQHLATPGLRARRYARVQQPLVRVAAEARAAAEAGLAAVDAAAAGRVAAARAARGQPGREQQQRGAGHGAHHHQVHGLGLAERRGHRHLRQRQRHVGGRAPPGVAGLARELAGHRVRHVEHAQRAPLRAVVVRGPRAVLVHPVGVVAHAAPVEIPAHLGFGVTGHAARERHVVAGVFQHALPVDPHVRRTRELERFDVLPLAAGQRLRLGARQRVRVQVGRDEPVAEAPEPAVAHPRVPVQRQRLQLGHGQEHRLRQQLQQVPVEVQRLQRGQVQERVPVDPLYLAVLQLQRAQVLQHGELGPLDLGQRVPVQVEHAEPLVAVERLGVQFADQVVTEVQLNEDLQLPERVFVHVPYAAAAQERPLQVQQSDPLERLLRQVPQAVGAQVQHLHVAVQRRRHVGEPGVLAQRGLLARAPFALARAGAVRPVRERRTPIRQHHYEHHLLHWPATGHCPRRIWSSYAQHVTPHRVLLKSH